MELTDMTTKEYSETVLSVAQKIDEAIIAKGGTTLSGLANAPTAIRNIQTDLVPIVKNGTKFKTTMYSIPPTFRCTLNTNDNIVFDKNVYQIDFNGGSFVTMFGSGGGVVNSIDFGGIKRLYWSGYNTSGNTLKTISSTNATYLEGLRRLDQVRKVYLPNVSSTAQRAMTYLGNNSYNKGYNTELTLGLTTVQYAAFYDGNVKFDNVYLPKFTDVAATFQFSGLTCKNMYMTKKTAAELLAGKLPWGLATTTKFYGSDQDERYIAYVGGAWTIVEINQ